MRALPMRMLALTAALATVWFALLVVNLALLAAFLVPYALPGAVMVLPFSGGALLWSTLMLRRLTSGEADPRAVARQLALLVAVCASVLLALKAKNRAGARLKECQLAEVKRTLASPRLVKGLRGPYLELENGWLVEVLEARPASAALWRSTLEGYRGRRVAFRLAQDPDYYAPGKDPAAPRVCGAPLPPIRVSPDRAETAALDLAAARSQLPPGTVELDCGAPAGAELCRLIERTDAPDARGLRNGCSFLYTSGPAPRRFFLSYELDAARCRREIQERLRLDECNHEPTRPVSGVLEGALVLKTDAGGKTLAYREDVSLPCP